MELSGSSQRPRVLTENMRVCGKMVENYSGYQQQEYECGLGVYCGGVGSRQLIYCYKWNGYDLVWYGTTRDTIAWGLGW